MVRRSHMTFVTYDRRNLPRVMGVLYILRIRIRIRVSLAAGSHRTAAIFDGYIPAKNASRLALRASTAARNSRDSVPFFPRPGLKSFLSGAV